MINNPLGKKRFRMPPRADGDPSLSITCGEDKVSIVAGEQMLVLSEHNAAVLLGCLSLMLNVRLQKRDGKAIVLTNAKRMTFRLE